MARTPYPSLLKNVTGAVAACVLQRCRFERMIVLIGHMRCGSTALSNIICSRPDISGQGESHVAYRSRGDVGVLALSLANRRVLKPAAPFLFEKILHSQYDRAASSDFFKARAIFLVRDPAASIVSIRKLFQRIGSERFPTDSEAAAYYLERVTTMRTLWPKFAPDRRVALTYEALIRQPNQALELISNDLRILPPLENRYDPSGTPWRKGGGDPVNAGRFSRIEPLIEGDPSMPNIEPALLRRCNKALADFLAVTT